MRKHARLAAITFRCSTDKVRRRSTIAPPNKHQGSRLDHKGPIFFRGHSLFIW